MAGLFKNPTISGILLFIVGVNFFVFLAISSYLGGIALGTLPSHEGFILAHQGPHTAAVSESTWVFSLYYTAATALLTPAIGLLCGAKEYWPRRREIKWSKKLSVGAFLTVWSILWFGGIGHEFLKSRADWKHLQPQSATSHR